MIIEIDDSKTIEDIQDSFNTAFPFLKIEFYEHPHHWYEPSSLQTEIKKTKKIADIRKQHNHGILKIYSWFKTGDVEQLFRKEFDLYIQVFYRQKNKWVQSAGSDNLTLKEQNAIGQSSEKSGLSSK